MHTQVPGERQKAVDRRPPDAGRPVSSPEPAAARQALALQRVVGNREVVRRLGATNIGAISIGAAPIAVRRAISADDMIKALRAVKGLKDLLNDRTPNAQGETVLQHARNMLNRYEQSLQKDDYADYTVAAMKLAMVARAVGSKIARDLNNPWLAPEISEKLIDYYEPEIQTQMKGKDVRGQNHRDKIVNIAKVTVSSDPVMLYMTGKVNAAEAAQKIADMARDANLPKMKMYRNLVDGWQAEMGSHDQAGIRAGTINRQRPGIQTQLVGEAELIGEISESQFTAMLNLDPAGAPQFAPAKGGLALTADATQKLTDLRGAVQAAAAGAVAGPVPGGLPAVLTDPQKRRIGNVEQAEQAQLAAQKGVLQSEVIAGLQTTLAVSAPQAARLVDQYVANFRTLPLTTSFTAEYMFKDPVGGDLDYQSALKRELHPVAYETLFPRRADRTRARGSVEALGVEHGMAEHRGNENYMRWRFEKDVKPPGFSDLGPAEIPEFGAISPTFAVAKGTEDKIDFGKNQYGSSHAVYKPAMKDRAMFQFTAKGPLRRDPLLLLHDIVVGAPENLRHLKAQYDQALLDFNAEPAGPTKAIKLQLLRDAESRWGTAKTKAHQAVNVLGALMSEITTPSIGFLDQQQIEVQMFGRVNFATDVAELHIDRNEDDAVRDNAQNFAQANGIQYSLVTGDSARLRQALLITDTAELIALVQGYLATGTDRKGTAFDALAATILGINQIPTAEQARVTTLKTELTTLWGAMSHSKWRQNRRQTYQQALAHTPALV